MLHAASAVCVWDVYTLGKLTRGCMHLPVTCYRQHAGKSTVSKIFADRGIPVIDADAIVHRLYSRGGAAVAPVGAAFPSAVVDGAVSRPDLSKCVVGDEEAMRKLEGIVHPLVEAERVAQMRQAAGVGARLLVLGDWVNYVQTDGR
jgi:dephospho-CoA kinase